MKDGSLKIFLGISPGVGKTYKMLLEGHKLLKDGYDIVIGYIEPHKRKDTQQLVQGIEQLDKQNVIYLGKQFEELDLYGLIRRKPQIALIDELAHTNTPGLKNEKRWQDVSILLERGISVFTTLNIQHIESLQIPLSQSSRIYQHEQIPDFFIDDSVEIELVDPPPLTIRERMLEGKIYAYERIHSALSQYFTLENLEILRHYTYMWLANRGFLALRRNYQNLQIMGFGEYIFVLLCDHVVEKHIVYRANLAKSRLPNAQFAIIRLITQSSDDEDGERAESNPKLKRFVSFVESFGGEYYEYALDESSAFENFMLQKNCTRVFVSFHQNLMRCKSLKFIRKILRGKNNFELTFIPPGSEAHQLQNKSFRMRMKNWVSMLSPANWSNELSLTLSFVFYSLIFLSLYLLKRGFSIQHDGEIMDRGILKHLHEPIIYAAPAILFFWKTIAMRPYLIVLPAATSAIFWLAEAPFIGAAIAPCILYYLGIKVTEERVKNEAISSLPGENLNEIFEKYGKNLDCHILAIRINDKHYLYEDSFFYKKMIYIKNRRYYRLGLKKIEGQKNLKILELNEQFHLLYSSRELKNERSLDILRLRLNNYLFQNHYTHSKRSLIEEVLVLLSYINRDKKVFGEDIVYLLQDSLYDLIKIHSDSEVRFSEQIDLVKMVHSIFARLEDNGCCVNGSFVEQMNRVASKYGECIVYTLDTRTMYYAFLLLILAIDQNTCETVKIVKSEESIIFAFDKLSTPLDIDFLTSKSAMLVQDKLMTRQELSIAKNKIVNFTVKIFMSLENKNFKVNIKSRYRFTLKFSR